MYEALEMTARSIQFEEAAPSYPFTGFVINLNVMTKAHRDHKDLKGCIVLVVGDFEGGELVLHEPGLVLELRSGDVVIFPSSKITHFNLHFRGRRASVVLHSDVEGNGYQKDFNGWDGNVHLTKVY
jgi:hypothetical protein